MILNWLRRWRRLRQRGVLGINQRNAMAILDLNPPQRFPLVDSKSRMHRLCRQIGVPTPRLYAIIPAHSGLRHLSRVLAERKDFVLKPDRGAGGRGILVIIDRDGDRFIRSNGDRLDFNDIHQHTSSIISGLYSLSGLPDAALVQQRIQPDKVFERISYEGTADIRVILYKDVPALAMLRLPTRESDGRANLHQGAVGAGIDLDTGFTTHAVLRDRTTLHHPDTHERVVGVQVPQWPRILEMSQKVSRAVGLGYVGIDILFDQEAGPLLLEGNARPGLAIQIANRRGLIHRMEEIEGMLAVQ